MSCPFHSRSSLFVIFSPVSLIVFVSLSISHLFLIYHIFVPPSRSLPHSPRLFLTFPYRLNCTHTKY